MDRGQWADLARMPSHHLKKIRATRLTHVSPFFPQIVVIAAIRALNSQKS